MRCHPNKMNVMSEPIRYWLWLGSCCVLGLCAPFPADAQVLLKKNVQVLLRVPLSAFTKQFKGGWLVYSGTIAWTGAGTVEVNGRGDWMERAFPSSQLWRLEDVGRPRAGGRLLKLRDRTLNSERALYLTIVGDSEQAFNAITALPQDSLAVGTAAVNAIASSPSMRELEQNLPGVGLRLVKVAAEQSRRVRDNSTADSVLGIEPYKAGKYLRFDLGEATSIYNDLRVSQGERVTMAFNTFVLSIAKAFTPTLLAATSLHGLKIELEVPHEDFLKDGPLTFDRLHTYFPVKALRSFEQDELTSQQLVDECVVLLDGNRIKVQLDR